MSPAENVILTRDQVRRVDECAIRELHFPSIVLMENAGKNAADWIRTHAAGPDRRALILCGSGNNGGDGLVIARHLHNAGWQVQVGIVGDAQHMSPDAQTNDIIARAIGIPRTDFADAEACRQIARGIDSRTVVIDALLGTGATGPAREPVATAIRILNSTPAARVIAIDVPSGLDCDTGLAAGEAVRADATITFVAPKPGFARPDARPCTGDVIVVDIGTPPDLIDRVRAEAET